MKKSEKILIFSRSEGHHQEYLFHLLDYILDSNSRDPCRFVLCPQLRESVDLKYNLHNLNRHGVRISSMRDVKTTLDRVRFFFEMRHRYANRASSMFIDFINPYIAILSSLGSGLKVSGIWFYPFIDPYSDCPRCFSPKSWLKLCLIRIANRNGALGKIYILGDRYAVRMLNLLVGAKLFECLSDPISVNVSDGGDCFHKAKALNGGKKRFNCLLIGSIDERKNLENIIKAFSVMSEDDRANYRLSILGKPVTAFRGEFTRLILEARQMLIGLEVVVQDKYLAERDFVEAFSRADLVFTLYSNTTSSSGIVLKAAQLGIPILGSSSGYLGYVIRRYRLGVSVNYRDLEAICKGIVTIASGKSNVRFSKSSELLAKSDSRDFSRSILTN